MQKQLMIGESDFRTLIKQGGLYVDKTDIIQQLLDQRKRDKVTLFTRPRRFGKTLTLSMLRYFFSLAHREEFAELFRDTDIMRSKARYRDLAGTKPVIFLTLKDVKKPTYTSFVDGMRLLMGKLYDTYAVILRDTELSAWERDFCQRVAMRGATENEMQESLQFLTEALARHYGQPVVLLLDEYDTPLEFARERGYYSEAVDFMRNFLSMALKDNESLYFAVITGVLRIAKESIFSGLNNLTVSSVANGGYAAAFGFTTEEVERLAKGCGQVNKLPELRAWYDGYAFQGVEIYNPWSVLNYFAHDCVPQAYWANTGSNGLIRDMLSQADARMWREMQGLMAWQSVVSPIDEDIVYQHILESHDALYSVLLAAGYLKSVARVPEEPDMYRLAIPNREVRSIYRREILAAMDAGKGNISSALYGLRTAMEQGDAATFEETLQDILRKYVSVHDAARPESFYHGLMLGLLLYFEADYRLESNRESGGGRFDIALFPRKKSLPGIVLEFKSVNDVADLAGAAQKALAQIKDKQYVTAMQKAAVPCTWLYGLAFCGKHVALASDSEHC